MSCHHLNLIEHTKTFSKSKPHFNESSYFCNPHTLHTLKDMQNTFLSSNFSRKCNGSVPFSFNDYTYPSSDRFCSNYFGYASQSPLCSIQSSSLVSCCAYCSNANSSICKVPVTPVYLCGLRQSNLIQYRYCKRVIFNRFDNDVSRFSGWDFEKGCNIRAKGVGRSRNGWGKGRYRCMVYEESGDELGIDESIDDEAEVLLSLLGEGVGEECFDVRTRNGRRLKKVIVEEKRDGGHQCVTCGSKKNFGSGISRNRLKFENELVVDKKRNVVDKTEERREAERNTLLKRGYRGASARREERYELLRGRLIKNEIDRTEERREEENKALLRTRHQSVSDRREDKDELLRESRKKERAGVLIENHTSTARKDYKEDLSRREEHKQRLGKDGSSCTSYHSLSSMGEYESNSGVQESQDEFDEGLTSKYKRNSGKLEEIEIDGKAERHEGYQGEQRLVLKKGKTVEGEDLWQKHSEKKLTDMSTEERRLRKESDVHDDVSIKASYKKYEGQEENATSMVKSNEERREHRRLNSDEVKQKTDMIKNYKEFKEHSEGYTQSSNTQKLDVRKTSSSGVTSGTRQTSSGVTSGTRQNNQAKDSSTVLSSVHDGKEKHYHHGRFSTQIDSRKTSRQLTEEVDIHRATISQRQSEHSSKKQEESSTSVHGSYHELVAKSDSKITMEKITNSGRNGADQRSRRKYDSVVTPPSPQRVPSGALHTGSSSGLVIEEVGHDSSHEDFERATIEGRRSNETYGQPLGYISHEDALGSADLLQKSSSYHVGEFMDKVRHDISSSAVQKEKQTHETKMKTKHDPKKTEQQAATEVVFGSGQLKEQRSSLSSGSKGPSAEMWDVDEQSNQEHPRAEVLDGNSADSVITKRAGRSLWNVMSDIVRFTWASRSTNQVQVSKTGGKNSPNQSTSSETWFSGNEPDENIQEGDKKRKGSISQQSTSVTIPKEEKSRARSQGGSSSSSSSKDQVQSLEGKALSYTEIPARGASGSDVPSLGEGSSHQQSEVIVSGASMTAGSSQSPSMRLRRSPYIESESSASGKVDSSGGGEIVQTELPVSTGVSKISLPEGKDEKQKSRKFLRTTQVVKDRFEEWEEAYKIEAEQRKIDEMFMREALEEARKAADSWEVPVGAVLVHDGKIIARGHNLVEELRDSTAHAEMICIREASKILHTWRLSETTLYVTLEPCAMCAGAILQARIDVIVWGAPNKLLGADGSWIRLFPSSGEGDNPSDKAAAPVHPFHPNIEIRRNVLASECADSMQQFFKRRRKKENKPEPPKSRLPILNQPSKFLSKMHDAFHIMFCL